MAKQRIVVTSAFTVLGAGVLAVLAAIAALVVHNDESTDEYQDEA